MKNEHSVSIRSRLRGGVCVLVLVAATALVTNQVASQDKPAKESKQGQEPPGMDPAMAAWMKYAAPGKHHAHLGPLAGSWESAGKFRMAPDAPMVESNSTSESTWILGGRFLLQKVEGEGFGDQPFEGLGILGYDNYKKKHLSIWMDNHGTMIMVSEGTCGKAGKVVTYTGEYEDPYTGKTKTGRMVYTLQGPDKYLMEMFDRGPDGKEYKSMEIVCTRKK